jgi:predicted transcriptional regulator
MNMKLNSGKTTETGLPLDELVAFFKALADANRLKIVGLLAEQPLSVEQLAYMLSVRPSTVSHHLAQLSSAGLVSARAVSYYNVYQLETPALEQMARRLLARQELIGMASAVDTGAYDRKVVADYTQADGRLKIIPAQRKKLEAILVYIIRSFEPGQHYNEKQVNEILGRFHADVATLRRELVGRHLLERAASGSDYWRPPADTKA